MAQGNPRPGEKYRHFKNKLYQIVTVAYHSETMERYVVYQALYGDFRTYVRPYEMFVSEVDHEKYPQAEQKYRFQLIEDMAAKAAGKEADPAAEEKTDPAAETAKEKTDPAQPSPESEEVPEGVNPWLIRFLDAENFDEKYEIICSMQREIDDKLIDDIAVVMDVAIPEGKLSERYAQLKQCVKTRQYYEQTRLR